MPEKKIELNVCGIDFSISTELGEDYIRQLAQYVDSRLDDIIRARDGGYVNSAVKSALLALNLADDVFKAREALEQKQREFDEFLKAFE